VYSVVKVSLKAKSRPFERLSGVYEEAGPKPNFVSVIISLAKTVTGFVTSDLTREPFFLLTGKNEADSFEVHLFDLAPDGVCRAALLA